MTGPAVSADDVALWHNQGFLRVDWFADPTVGLAMLNAAIDLVDRAARGGRTSPGWW